MITQNETIFAGILLVICLGRIIWVHWHNYKVRKNKQIEKYLL